MLEDLKTFYSNNTTMIIFAAIALIAMLGLFMFKPNLFKKTTADDMGGMGGMGGMCDSSSGMCYPHSMMYTPPPPVMNMQDPSMMNMPPPVMNMQQAPMLQNPSMLQDPSMVNNSESNTEFHNEQQTLSYDEEDN